jgi:hypothetical protein
MRERDRQALAVLKPALKELMRSRRLRGVPHTTFKVRSTDGVDLFCTRIEGGSSRKAVVLAHAAIGRSYQHWMVNMARELMPGFTVFMFDFRGHGRSSGRCPLRFDKPSQDLEAVVEHVRSLGFERIGVTGYSIGAAAGFLLAARKPVFDSFVSIGCPPRMVEFGDWFDRPLIDSAVLRLLGMRVDRTPKPGPNLGPEDVADDLPPIPKFLIFGEWEVFPPEDIERFAQSVSPPSETFIVPGVWHAELGGRESMVREWFENTL